LNGKNQREKVLETSEEGKLEGQNLILLEAALYVAGRPLDLKTLGSVAGIRSKRTVKDIARGLLSEYKERNTALEILELEDERFVMQLKAAFSPRVRRLAVRPLLSMGPLKTLSYIAYRQPVQQKLVIEARGGHAYAHIRALREAGLIEWEKDSKTRVIRTTDYFADYFGLSHDPKAAKQQMRRIFDEIPRRMETTALQGHSDDSAR